MVGLPAQFEESLTDGTCLRLVLSRKLAGATCEADKVTVRPVTLRGELHYQFALRTGSTERHENLSPRDAVRRVREWFGPCFADAHLFTAEADWSFRWTTGGQVRAKRKRPTLHAASPEHDRQKRYLIPEGEPCAFLAEIGVMTPEGKVRAAKQAKFRQINRYLELVDDVLDALPTGRELNVIDFGCGKSYLTFALHHLLTVIRGRPARVTGLDVKSETIEDCRRIAGRLGLKSLEFHVGRIEDFEPDRPVDLAVSLHACDTATDDALAQAVRWQTPVILAVPCCQHELAGKIDVPPLSPLLEHGILKERFAALATDALRAKVLELCGYRTQVVEFIDMEHTAKNLLIRAIRHSFQDGPSPRAIEDYRGMKASLGLENWHLEERLGDLTARTE